MWQLFKGIESPYKSVLKLLLTEVYASEHPKVECLALRFKQAVFANRLDVDEFDPISSSTVAWRSTSRPVASMNAWS